LPQRRAHTLAVGEKAEAVAAVLNPAAHSPLVISAYLHDIGYAHRAADTGLHQLDGARFLAGRKVSMDVCRLVAHHSLAHIEADARGLSGELVAEFPRPAEAALYDALMLLTYCDMTTS